MPTTPPQTHRQLQELQATPAHRGSSSAQDSFTDHTYMEMRGPLLDDLKGHQRCEVLTMLKALLKRCMKTGEQCQTDVLLRDCFDAVKNAFRGDDAEYNKLLQDLEAFTNASPEKAKYPHFVNVCNRLLGMLHETKICGLRDPSSLDIKFICNDPMRIVSDNAQLSPDIVIISSKDDPSAAINNPGDGPFVSDTDDEENPRPLKQRRILPSVEPQAEQAESSKPQVEQAKSSKPSSVRLTWDKLLSAVEGKVGKKSKFSRPCLDYSDTIEKIPPQEHKEAQNESSEGSTRLQLPAPGGKGGTKRGRSSTPSVSTAQKPPMLQVARYAMARHSSSAAIAHTINMIFNGTVIYLWYYDSEGSIQTYGLDMINNLPYFGILLLAFQRFTEAEWGVIAELRDALSDSSKALTFPATGFNQEPIEITINSDTRFRTSHALHGRRTCVYGARKKSEGDAGKDLVLKAYFPERARVSEAEIIQEATKLEDNEPDIRGHLPTVICHMDFNDFATDRIRHDLNLSSEDKTNSVRLPRLIVFVKYEKFVMAFKKGTDVFEAEFWKLFRCHYRLWLHGVEHGDISLGNLLWDPVENIGKLNDFDLARLRGKSINIGHARTGTMAFMAMDLLSDEGLSGQIPRMYRHDAESFFWVLFWVLARYNGTEEVHSHFDSFQAPSYEQCYKEKATCMQIAKRIESYNPELWQSACEVLFELKNQHEAMQFRRQPPSKWKEYPKEAVEWCKTLFPQMADALADLKLTL